MTQTASPIRILVHGASGRMGRQLLQLASADMRFVVVAAVSRSGASLAGSAIPVFRSNDWDHIPSFDVAIDFSLAEAFDGLLENCVHRGAALVSGTTALSDSQRNRMAKAEIPMLWAANFSIGVAVLEALVQKAAEALPAWKVDITETHHMHKKDAPSGTALTLAAAVTAGGGQSAAIESARTGEVIGDHEVRFTGPSETLRLAHHAADRATFAAGALEAAARLHGLPAGNYRLPDLLFGAAVSFPPPSR